MQGKAREVRRAKAALVCLTSPVSLVQQTILSSHIMVVAVSPRAAWTRDRRASHKAMGESKAAVGTEVTDIANTAPIVSKREVNAYTRLQNSLCHPMNLHLHHPHLAVLPLGALALRCHLPSHQRRG